MPEKKNAVRISDSIPRESRQELQVLYERRTAIDELIQSLQRYDRYRAQRMEESEHRKSA